MNPRNKPLFFSTYRIVFTLMRLTQSIFFEGREKMIWINLRGKLMQISMSWSFLWKYPGMYPYMHDSWPIPSSNLYFLPLYLHFHLLLLISISLVWFFFSTTHLTQFRVFSSALLNIFQNLVCNLILFNLSTYEYLHNISTFFFHPRIHFQWHFKKIKNNNSQA